MQKIDAHLHFWKFDSVRDSWITEDMAVIRKNFLSKGFKPLLIQNGFIGCVAVQANNSEGETDFLIELAKQNSFIKGVVGWVDLQSDAIDERLEHYSRFTVLKGFRHISQAEEDRALMLQPSFVNGIAALMKYGFTYDLLIVPDQLGFAKELVALFPEQKFVIDHIAKPNIKNGILDGWQDDIYSIAQNQNVCCKISGLVTQANRTWIRDDFIPYLKVVVEAFGFDRILFGSDWPVCLLAASYNQTFGLLKDFFSSFTSEQQQQFFAQNAIQFYNL